MASVALRWAVFGVALYSADMGVSFVGCLVLQLDRSSGRASEVSWASPWLFVGCLFGGLLFVSFFFSSLFACLFVCTFVCDSALPACRHVACLLIDMFVSLFIS